MAGHFVSMATISTAQFRKGIFIEFKSEPNQIVEFQHVNPGKGSAFVRTKLKSLKTGRTQVYTYKSGESVEEVPVVTRELQYLYRDNGNFVFMDNTTFEQYNVGAILLGNYEKFIKPNDVYQVLMHEDKPVGVRFPKKVRLTVTEADDGTRGDSVTGATKVVTVETGLSVTVPLFIKIGDTIAVDPESGNYLERISN
jgi:elongation factor P